MKKSTLICSLILTILVLSISFNLNLAFSSVSSSSSQPSPEDEEPTLQDWLTSNGYAINVTADESGIETFPAGYYKLAILAEYAAYAPNNNLSWYPIDDGKLHTIFHGENVTDDATYFMADEPFGFCLGSPDGYFYTESKRNENETDHALVFRNSNSTGYIIAWEDLLDLGDGDFQDLILAAISPATADVFYFPRTLNLKSNGNWITAILKLPKEYMAKDVDINSIMVNNTLAVDVGHYSIHDCEDLHLLVVKISRTAVIEFIRASLGETGQAKSVVVSLTLTGNFSDEVPFEGTDWIRAVHISF